MRRTIVGFHAVKEALKIRASDCSELSLRTDFERHHGLKQLAQMAQKSKIKIVPRDVGYLDKLHEHHQGAALVCNSAPEFDPYEWNERAKPTDRMILVALDEISDPHNTGAILRTAWLLGARAIFIPEHRSASLSPTVTKVASGGAEHVAVNTCSNLPNELNSLKDIGFWVFGLAADGESIQRKKSLPERIVLVVGAEDKGLRSTVKSVCDEIFSLPQLDRDASYNASVAAALALYEVTRGHV